MKITAPMVKELRQRTGSGMMECKKALAATDGDMERAIENMRKAGLAKADKKASRVATEGMIGIKISDDATRAAIIDINSETDFVTKSDDFITFVNLVTEVVLKHEFSSTEQLLSTALTQGQTVDETRRSLVAKVGENITLRRFEKKTTTGSLASYIHGSKIGILVELSDANVGLGKDIAMHIAAMNPQYISESDVPAEVIAKEKEIISGFIKTEALESGKSKPDAIIEKMTTGRLKKFLSEITLLGQKFVKDDKITIAQLLTLNKTQIISFTRFEVGEGIEKIEEDFATEVMAQINA